MFSRAVGGAATATRQLASARDRLMCVEGRLSGGLFSYQAKACDVAFWPECEVCIASEMVRLPEASGSDWRPGK